MSTQPSPTRQSRAVERLARHRDPRAVIRARRGRLFRPPVLELYYEPGDPLSHLCAQLLPMLSERVRAPIEVRLVGESRPPEYPEAARQRSYALRDAARIAPARGLHFPPTDHVPDVQARMELAGALAETDGIEEFARREAELAPAVFAGEHTGRAVDEAAIAKLLAANDRRRRALGHYLPAMWQFDGDWFWGLDRFDFLEDRLRGHALLAGDEPLSVLEPAKANLPTFDGPLPKLEFFFSFRSPYSYLAALEMQRFHAEWPSGVEVRPLLPMAMRGITISKLKQLYTLRDVKRVADQKGVDFGRAVDPLGEGARRCLQVFPLAEGTQQQLDFLASAARGVWAEGLAVVEDPALKYVCERAGISWTDATVRLSADVGIKYAERNREALLAHGLWGVPDFVIGDFGCWGQDRFWMVREILRRSKEAATDTPAAA
jgi:2-hydroxychromene-2-carboxylate isomerase